MSKTEADTYQKEGSEYAAAWEKLSEEIKLPHVPPSLEVFKQELTDSSRGWKRVSANELANRLIREHKAA